MHRANSRLGVEGKESVSSRNAARNSPTAAKDRNDDAEPQAHMLVPQPAESPPKAEGGIGRYSLRGRLGSLWPASTSALIPAPALPPLEGASPAQSREGDAHEGEHDDESEETWEPETEASSDGSILSGEEYSAVYGSKEQADIKERAPTAEPQSWLRASVSYAIGGWGKAAGLQYQAIPPGNLEETAISSEPARDLSTSPHPVTPTQHKVVTVEDLEGLVVWHDPLRTGKIFGAGLYFLVCLRHLMNGVEIIQPSTVLAFSAICYILYNSLKSMLRQRRRPNEAVEPEGTEEALQRKVEGVVAQVAATATPIISASVALVARRLSSHSTKGSRFWLACCMWLVITLGELGWVSQASLAIYLWAGLFTAPLVYLTCRTALDALVDECFAFLLTVLQGGSRGVLLGSTILGMGVFAVTDARVFIRITLAVASSAAVLFWQAHYARKTNATVERALSPD